ncbi:transglycosylase domain-containing protein [Propioniciclava flava]|uniref:Penicillin-binding protein n=1 Tax=Propioniciclava flava TaxID=2072026 RepID=A0A4Q2EFG9_9ACTN|nr:transglycosylase domain-containing protein [Propioniciclava flava]RXW31376.1 penicillin-binding protein [Propioniciclava flava]
MTDSSQGTPPSASRSTGRKPRTPGRVVLSILKWIVIVGVALAVIGAGVFGVLYARQGIPNPNTDFQTNLTSVYYADGQEQMSTFAVQNRVSIPLSEMPQTVKQSVVAGENETFWEDPGISIAGLMRAAASLVGPKDAVGGSTITQQYVKVMYLTQEKTFTRKLTEILVALKIGQELSKEDILERYLNAVYFGRGAYGIQAASQAYFGVDAKDLNLAQSVALTAIINSPNNLDPGRGEAQRRDLLERYQYVLNQMVKLKYITDDQRAQIYTALPDFPALDSAESRWGGHKGHLLKMVQDELKGAGFDDAQIQGGGLRITTTIDKTMQDAAVSAAQDQANRIAKAQNQDPNYYHPAIASIDTGTGAILAMYGGPNYTADYTNYATTPRAAGSTFKPWALVAGLRDGASLTDRFNGNTFTLKGEPKPITNGGHNYGPVTLEKATTSSINTAYVDLVTQMKDGPQKVIQAALDAGLTNNKWQATANIPLGSAEVSPLEAARGFATLANEGRRTTPHIIAQVTDMKGQVVYSPTINPEQTVENDVSINAVNALLGVTQDGTGQAAVAGLKYEVAGKTGTNFSNGETLATWFVGATRQISTAFVLTAGPEARSNLGRNTYGSTYSAVGWNAYMKVAMAGKDKIDFPAPVKQTRKGSFTAPPAPSPTATVPTAAPMSGAQPTTPTTKPEPADPVDPEDPTEPTDAPTSARPTTRPTHTPPGKPTTTPTARP